MRNQENNFSTFFQLKQTASHLSVVRTSVRVYKKNCIFSQAISLLQLGKGPFLNSSVISWLFGQNSANIAVGVLVSRKFFNDSFDREGRSSDPHEKWLAVDFFQANKLRVVVRKKNGIM